MTRNTATSSPRCMLRMLGLAFAIATASIGIALTSANASSRYPWCLQGAGLVCDFTTQAQCQASASGTGGSCVKFG